MELNKNVYFVSSDSYVPKNVMKNNDLKKIHRNFR